MNDCQNIDVREALPELVHGTLPEPRLGSVLLHVVGCVDCAAELAIIRAVLKTATPLSVDVVSIAAAIPPYGHVVDVGMGSRPRWFQGRAMQLAAAMLIGAVGISALVVDHQRSAELPATSITNVRSVASGDAGPGDARQIDASRLDAGVALVGTSDLTDDRLEQLIQTMGQLDAVPPAEPEPLIPVTFDGGVS